MTERPLNHDEEHLIQTCFWAINQGGLTPTDLERHDAMLQFYLLATPVQARAIIEEMANLADFDEEDWDE